MMRLDVAVTAFMVCGLVALLTLWFQGHRRRSDVSCMANLKQIWSAIVNEGQQSDLSDITDLGGGSTNGFTNLPARVFQILWNTQRLSPRALVCPGDKRRSSTSVDTLQNDNISYFLSTNLSLRDNKWIVAGDRNISAKSGILLRVADVRELVWHAPMLHDKGGHLIRADCSGGYVTNSELKAAFLQGGNQRNHLLIP